MLKLRTWRMTGQILIGIVLLFVGLWTSGVIPNEGKYCEYNAYTEHEKCATYQVAIVWIRYVGWFLDASSAVITTLATTVIGGFTATIWLVNRSQLRHSHQIERAYISGGGIPETTVLEP